MAANINALLRFCEVGDLPSIKDWIDFDIEDEDGHTALQVACANNHVDVVKYLLDQKVDINKSNFCGWTSLHHAAFHGHFEIVKLLIKSKSLLTKPTHFGATPLDVAVSGGHFNVVKLLAKEGALMHAKNHSDSLSPNPLINAILHYGTETMIDYFIEFNAEWIFEPLPITKWTPLMFSIDNEKLLTKLLDNGADPNVLNIDGKSALDLAVNDKSKIILQNAKNYIDKEAIDKQKYIQSKFIKVCKDNDIHGFYKILKDDTIDINDIEVEGTTGLMISAMNGHTEMLQFLIHSGANLDLKDTSYGWTALMYATFYGQLEAVKILLKHGADPTIPAQNGCTALDLATLSDDSDTQIIRILAKEINEIAPPFMSHISSRHPSGITRSTSTPIINSGISSWWQKISSRFKLLKSNEKKKKFKHSVSINVIPDSSESSDESSQQSAIYTLGFTGNEDLEETNVFVERPKEARIMLPQPFNGPLLPKNPINTKHLLSNYNRKLLESSFNFQFGVQKILQDLSLREKYSRIFEEQEIDLEAFVLLNNEDLMEIGVKRSRDRRKLLSEIKRIGKLLK